MSDCNLARSDSEPMSPSLEIKDVLLSHIFRVSSHGLRLFVMLSEQDTYDSIIGQLLKQMGDEMKNSMTFLYHRSKGHWMSIEMFFDDIRDAMELNTLLLKKCVLSQLKIKVEYISPVQRGPPSLRCLTAFSVPKKARVTKYIELWRSGLQSHFKSVLGTSAIPELTTNSKRHLDIWFYSIKAKLEFQSSLKVRKGLLNSSPDGYSEYKSRRELVVNRATFLLHHLEIYTCIKRFLIIALMIPHFSFDLSEDQQSQVVKEGRKLYKEEEPNLPEICSTIDSKKLEENDEIILNPESGFSLPRNSPLFHPPLVRDLTNQLGSVPTIVTFHISPSVFNEQKTKALPNSEEIKSKKRAQVEKQVEESKQGEISVVRGNQKERYHVKNAEKQRGLFNPSYCPPKAHLNFTIYLEEVQSGKDKRRTLMLKNIPNFLSQIDVMELINKKFKGYYDYFYLPIDFKFHRNVGYAFINLDSSASVIRFVKTFQGMHWKSSHKIADVTYARTQGLKALMNAAKNSQVSKTQNDPRLKPVILKLR